MGLFSNNKKPCPICGAATPRLLATKIEGIPICKECDKKIDLPDGVTDQMSLENFRQYLAFYDANQFLRETFTQTAKYDFRFMRDDFLVDAEHRLFRLKNRDEGLVFEASCLKSFRIWEDRNLLFEGDTQALRCHESDVPDRVAPLQADISRFMRDRQEFERMERMERMLENRNRDRDGNPPPRRYIPEPRFETPGPVRKFRMELVMEHPYWRGYRLEWDGPSFNSTYPSIDEYLSDYHQEVDELYALSCGLMTVLNPDAQELRVGFGETGTAVQIAQEPSAPSASAPAGDAVAEIQKYKTLLDAGVITEEEFSAKKKLLLGI